MSIKFKSVQEVEQSLLRDHLKSVDTKDEVGTMRQIKKSRKQAVAVQKLRERVRQAQEQGERPFLRRS